MICRCRTTTPWLSRPVALFMASTGFISGPSKLSLLAKFGTFNPDTIWFTFDPKLATNSRRRFISFSVLYEGGGIKNHINNLVLKNERKNQVLSTQPHGTKEQQNTNCFEKKPSQNINFKQKMMQYTLMYSRNRPNP